MTTIQKNNLVNILGTTVIGLTVFQGLIPGMPITQPAIVTFLSVLTMYLVQTLTFWKQKLSSCIDNNALLPTIILCVVATFGGMNDVLKLIPLTPTAGQWIRFGITAVTAILNVLSSTLFPSKSSNC